MRTYSLDIRMEFGIEKCAMLIMKSGKREAVERKNYQIRKALECLEKRKMTNIWEYWKQTPSNKRRKKKKKKRKEKTTSKEWENFLKQSSVAQISSNGLSPGKSPL